jgi:hypothetical protein
MVCNASAVLWYKADASPRQDIGPLAETGVRLVEVATELNRVYDSNIAVAQKLTDHPEFLAVMFRPRDDNGFRFLHPSIVDFMQKAGTPYGISQGTNPEPRAALEEAGLQSEYHSQDPMGLERII